MKITKVYTRRGDSGMTDLIGGERAEKCSARLEAYGTVDEFSAQLGLLAALLPDGEDKTMIQRIQNTLFIVCSHLATDQATTPLPPFFNIPAEEVALIEKKIDSIQASFPEAQGFILSGGTTAAAQAHVCRTVCRRAERRILTLKKEATVGEDILKYVNRLSDYLFVLAKKINFNAGQPEIIWQKV